MNMFTKKTAFGTILVASAGLVVAGIAAPAIADKTAGSNSSVMGSIDRMADSSVLDTLASDVGIQGIQDIDGIDSIGGDIATGDVSNDSPIVVAPEVGDVAVGDVASGNTVASGNDVTVPVTAPVVSGNNVTAPVVSGNDTSGQISDVVDGTIDGNVDQIVDDVLADVDLSSILGE